MSLKYPVLIIDDDAWLTNVLAKQLQKAGFAPYQASNAIEGMALIDKIKPSAVILDIMMPGPNGFVLLHEIRSHSDLAQIPIVVCSNTASDIPRANLSAYGVVEVLDKTTMESSDVVAAVRRCL